MLWLTRRPAASAPIQYLAYELPYATDGALKKKRTKIKNNSIQEFSSGQKGTEERQGILGKAKLRDGYLALEDHYLNSYTYLESY